MFSQVDAALDRSQGGLGIGLALARGLVEMHGGQISAHSDGSGHGWEFTVRLPAPAQAPVSAQPSVPCHAPRASGPSRKGLLVDDNHDDAQTLLLMLADSGHQVRVAYDGDAALTLARVEMPEVALLDIGLPRSNGYALCRAFRAFLALPVGNKPFVVAASGWGRAGDRCLSAEAGFDMHLVKPVPLAQLEALVADRGRNKVEDRALTQATLEQERMQPRVERTASGKPRCRRLRFQRSVWSRWARRAR